MSATSSPRVPVSTADNEALQAHVHQFLAGRNQSSGEGFAAPFADVGGQVAFDGAQARERRA